MAPTHEADLGHNSELFSRFEGLTFDDVVLVPVFIDVLPDIPKRLRACQATTQTDRRTSFSTDSGSDRMGFRFEVSGELGDED